MLPVLHSHASNLIGSIVPESKRRRSIIIPFAVGVLAAIACSSWGLYAWLLGKTRDVPSFYLDAEKRLPSDLRAASLALEKDVRTLTTQLGQLGSWDAEFSEVQINAWLVHQAPKVFSRVLPKGVSEPRIVLQDGKALVAARFQDKHWDTVVSFELTVQLTEEANVVAMGIREVRAGSLRLPLQPFIDSISKWAARDSLEIRWDTNEANEPIALFTIPSDHDSYLRKPVIVESLNIMSGKLSLAGHTGAQARMAFKPRGPVYRLCGLRPLQNY